MTDRLQHSELHDRRQIYNRISDLKSSCENLARIKQDLLSRLSELNDVADRLIDEKNNQNIRPTRRDIVVERLDEYQTQPKYSSEMNDLNRQYKFATHHEITTTHKSKPSNAFKLKLSLCLQEVVSKAEEIVQLSDHIPSSQDTFYND